MFIQGIQRKARKFRSETGGSAAIAFAVTLPVLVGFTALAADIGNAYSQEEKLKQLTETVALAALVEIRKEQFYGLGGKVNEFKPGLVAFAKTNMHAAARGLAVKEEDIEFGTWDFRNQTFLPDTGSTQISAVRVKGYMNAVRGNQLPSFFGKLFVDSFDISTESTAVLPIPPDFHVLNQTAGPAMIVDDTDIDTISAVINSSAPDALLVQGARSSFGTFKVHVAGGYSGSSRGMSEAARKVKSKIPGMADFLKDQPSPSATGCTFVNYAALPISNEIVIKPGTYCGGLKIDVPADKVVFKPGVYVFKGGPLLIKNQKDVFGDRVFLFLTGRYGGLDVRDSKIRLRAQMNGKWAGMTIMSDRRPNFAPKRNLIERSTFASAGTIYMPGSKLEFNFGFFNITCKGLCVAADTMVFRRLYINGYNGFNLGSFTSFPGSTDIPMPVGLAKSFRPYLIEQPVVPAQPAEPGQS